MYNCISPMWLYFQAQFFWALQIDHIGHLWPCEHRALLHLTSEIFNLRIYHPFGMVSEVLIYLIILIFYLIPLRICILPAIVMVAIKVSSITGLVPYFYSIDGTAFRTVDDRFLYKDPASLEEQSRSHVLLLSPLHWTESAFSIQGGSEVTSIFLELQYLQMFKSLV